MQTQKSIIDYRTIGTTQWSLENKMNENNVSYLTDDSTFERVQLNNTLLRTKDFQQWSS